MRKFAPLFSVLAAALLMMAVAFADGRPSVFYDSHSYDVMGRNLIQVVGDFPDSLHFKMKPGVTSANWPVNTDRLVDAEVEGARSPFYGVLLHGTYQIGTLWLLAAIQSLLAAWMAYLLWRTLAPGARLWSYVLLCAGVVVGSSLPFFTAFGMPDVFAGIGGCALALVLTQPDRLTRREQIGVWIVLAYSLAIHKSHLATAAATTGVGALLLWLMGLDRKSLLRRAGLVLAALAVAWGSGMAFGAVYKARTGLELGHPPFLLARVLADGPGLDYLKETCARDPTAFAACRFSNNVTANSTENLLLWSNRPNLGVFNIATRPVRVQLEQEETKFVVGVVLHKPLEQVGHALMNWGYQLALFQVDDPLRDPAAYLIGRYWPTTTLPQLIPNFDGCRPPLSCRPPFSHDGLAWWHGVVLAAALGFLGWRATRRELRPAFSRTALSQPSEPARLIATLSMLLLVVVLNAAVCGVLSGPFARYQARLIWLLPLAAGLAACVLPLCRLPLRDAAAVVFRLIDGIWEWFRRTPKIGRFLPPLNGHLMRFGLVGGLGFVVDGGVLQLMVMLGLHPIPARAVSFPIAVLATWLANRTFTFPDKIEQSKLREASTYVAVQLVGGAANFVVYSGLILKMKFFAEWPLIALAFGSAAGLTINYLGSKHIVFRRSAPAP